MADSPLFEDVRVFYLEFLGPPRGATEREGWADPLRLEVLQRFSRAEQVWYLGFIEPGTVGWVDTWTLAWWDTARGLQKALVPYTNVQSEIQSITKPAFLPRRFMESSAGTLPHIFAHYWPTHVAGYPIEGYLMEPGQIKALHEWDRSPRDANLFRDVLDKAFVAFYTFPEENRDFVFVTAKLDLEELSQILKIETLQKRALELADETD